MHRLPLLNCQGIRSFLADMKPDHKGMYEICNAQFYADEPSILGTPNENWHERELKWYLSQSLSVHHIPPPIPKIWRDVSSDLGQINSNYGWCVFSKQNGKQFNKAIESLLDDEYSRQSLMIYTRPSMHYDAKKDGMRDFMCTNTVQLMIRDGKMDYTVSMRSSDMVFGYKGDRAWHNYVFNQAVEIYNQQLELFELDRKEVEKGDMIWNATSFHVYPRHAHLVEELWEKL